MEDKAKQLTNLLEDLRVTGVFYDKETETFTFVNHTDGVVAVYTIIN